MSREQPVVRIGSRFLPVPAAVLPPVPDECDLVDLPVAPGTPVHAMQAGRVVSADGETVGEVILRVDGDDRLHYRRLVPSSVTVREGDAVDAGDVLGIVAPPIDDGVATLRLGVQRPDGSWTSLADVLVGLADPLELFLQPPMAGSADLVAALPSQRMPARRRSPAGSTEPAAPSEGPAPDDDRAGPGRGLVGRRDRPRRSP